MNTDQIQSLVRAAVISIGAGLVDRGFISHAQLNEIAGIVIAAGAIAWSVIQKRESAKLSKAVATVNTALASGDAAHGVATASGQNIVVANS